MTTLASQVAAYLAHPASNAQWLVSMLLIVIAGPMFRAQGRRR